jgi:hypothetical protein
LAGKSPEERARLVRENAERLKGMDDSQYKAMADMVKNNKEQVRQMYKAQGMNLTDE